MAKCINKIKLFIKDNSYSMIVANSLKEKLLKNNFKIVNKDYDIAIAIGGDGTFLSMIQDNEFTNKVIYVGINSGNLGFFEEIEPDELDMFVDSLKNNNYILKELSYLNVKIFDKKNIFNYRCLNEVVVRNVNYKTLIAEIYINNKLLENFFGDGILICSPTGSTAYNLSVGGPIVYDNLPCITITPIAPINNMAYSTLRNSLIIPNNKKVIIKPDKNKQLSIVMDGNLVDNKEISKIEISNDKKNIKCIRMKDYSFEELINKKIIN